MAPAILLVVFLLVALYKAPRGKSRQILPCPWPAYSGIAQEEGLQPGGYDFLWLFSAPLAADRGGTAHYCSDSPPHLQGIPHSDVAACSRARKGNIQVLGFHSRDNFNQRKSQDLLVRLALPYGLLVGCL